MKFYILTLFPEMIETDALTSIIGRAVDKGVLSYEAINIRDFSASKHKKVDDYPYGGGAGMVMQAQPIYDAWNLLSNGRRIRCGRFISLLGGDLFTGKSQRVCIRGGSDSSLRAL